MEKVATRGHNLQRLWALPEGTKCFQTHKLEAPTFHHSSFVRTTIARSKEFSIKNHCGIFNWCYLRSCGPYASRIVPGRGKMQWDRWSGRLQRLPSIQQQSLQERTLHHLPGETTSITLPKRSANRCPIPNRCCFSKHPSAKHNSSCGLSKLWNHHYSIMEKGREWSYNLQRLWYVYFVPKQLRLHPC